MERRKLNLNNINSMDLRDFNTDQQKAKEIINLVKDKDGWRLRDPYWQVHDNITSTDEVRAFFMQGDKAVVAIGQYIYIYSVSNEELQTLLERYDMKTTFDLWATNYPSVYFFVDRTNHKSYVLEFTDRVMTAVDDKGDLEQSTELVLNEYDARTDDLIWAGMSKHLPYNSVTQVAFTNVAIGTNSTNICLHYLTTSSLAKYYQINVSGTIYMINSVYSTTNALLNSAFVGTNANISAALIMSYAGTTTNNSLNKYMLNWDTYNTNTANEWHAITVCRQNNYSNNDARYVIFTGYGAGTGVSLFSFSDDTPYKWSTFVSDSANNIFKVDGTTAGGNDRSRFLDVIAGGATSASYSFTGWNPLEGTESSSNRVINTYGMIYNSDSNIWAYGSDASQYSRVEQYDGTQWVQRLKSSYTYPFTAFNYVNDNCYITAMYTDGTPAYIWLYKGIKTNTYQYVSVYQVSTGTKIGGLKYISDTNHYIALSHGMYNYNGASLNTFATWTNLSTGLSGANCNIRAIYVDGGANIFGITANCAVQYDGTDWSNVNSGLSGGKVDMLCMEYVGGDDVYAGTTAGVVHWDGTEWIDVNSATLGADQRVQAIDYVNSTYILAGTDTGGMYIYNSHAWVKRASTGMGSTNVLAVAYGSSYKQYVGTNNSGPYYTAFTYNPTATGIDAYIPNDDAIGHLNYGGTSLFYNSAYASVSGDCLGIKAIDATFDDGGRYKYLIFANEVSGSTCINVYLISSEGDAASRETTANESSVCSSATLSNAAAQWTYTCYIGMTVIANQYYELQNPNLKGYTAFVAYTDSGVTRFDTVDFVLGTNASTIVMYRNSVGAEINSDSVGYMAPRTQCFIWSTGQASIFPNGQQHYVYANRDSRVIRYPITGNQMTTDDVTKITYVYNSEYSRYCDPDGQVMCGLISDPLGYKLTEINQSIKAPVRPYFTADLADTLYANSNLNSYEIFQSYEMTTPDGVGFRTPIDVGKGADLTARVDTGTKHHKYWMVYLLDSGLLDDTIPYITLAKGTKDATRGTYSVYFWEQNADLIEKVYPDNTADEVGGLPHRFNNINIDANDISNVMENGKIFHKIGDADRDKFNVAAYYSTSKSIVFEIQDLVFTAAGLMITLNFDDKILYYSTGFKFINLLNQKKLNSRATAIQEIGNNTFAVVGENDIYIGMALGEDTFNLTWLTNNIGLEKDNFKSLVTNGQDAFFQNRRGVWMIRASQVVNIGLPLEDYLYKQESGNKLGIDGNTTSLYIPLDNTKMTNLQYELHTGDYSAATDYNVVFDKAFGVFDYSDLSFKIFAYVDSQSGYQDFFGTLKDHLVARVGDKLVIPTNPETTGEETVLGRFKTKRMSFGNVQSLKKLYDVLFYFINNKDTNDNEYGVDYVRLMNNYNKGKATWAKKMGDFDATETYTDANQVTDVRPDDRVAGWTMLKIPIGHDMNDVETTIEFARLNGDGYYALTTFNEADFDIIQKNAEKYGAR